MKGEKRFYKFFPILLIVIYSIFSYLFFYTSFFSFLDFKKNIDLDNKINSYFEIIKNQENVLVDVNITDEEKAYFKKCDLGVYKDYRCFAKFYEKYTERNGLVIAFSHLAKLNKELPEYFEACHIITHGIGHAQLRANAGDVARSLLDVNMQSGMFKNMSTCANGYFHGIVEEYVKDIKNEDELAQRVEDICKNYQYDKKAISEGGCFHGVGHAVFLQLDYDFKKSLQICDKITYDPNERFNCYTGVFMEDLMDIDQKEIFTFQVKKGEYSFNFKRCDEVNEIYRPACYMEVSVLFENLSKNKNDYSENIKFCKYLGNEVYKMACIKQMAYRAITGGYKRPYDMCKVLENDKQKMICYATYGYRLASSIPEVGNVPKHTEIWQNVCDYMNDMDAKKCFENIAKNSKSLYFTPEKGLNF